MFPSHIVWRDSLPRELNGKYDRVAPMAELRQKLQRQSDG
jgi:hypothetical protein